ncbi:MAG: tetratricopeptide repeat protein [Nitrospinae bacterium]|nr:tetratricopeptide repeat protein [Nitrospinota bacterium]
MQISELEDKFNSAKEKISPVEMVEAIIPLVNAYQQVRKYDSAVHCLQNALPIIRDKGEAGQEAVILTALGTAFWEKAQLQKALDQFSPALDLFKKSGDKIGERTIYAMVGITFWRKCEWQRALELFTDVWSETEGLLIDNRFASVQGALERGIVTLQNRVRMGRELQDSLKILQPLFSVCVLYRMLGNREQFDNCFNEAVALAESINKTDILNAAKDLRQLIN